MTDSASIEINLGCVISNANTGKKMFLRGQTAFYVDQEGRAHDCIVDGYHGEEILVSKDGKAFGWFTDDTLFHSTSEAYASVSILS